MLGQTTQTLESLKPVMKQIESKYIMNFCNKNE